MRGVLRIAGGALRSPFHRREGWCYLRYLARGVGMAAAVRRAAQGLAGWSAVGQPPPGFPEGVLEPGGVPESAPEGEFRPLGLGAGPEGEEEIPPPSRPPWEGEFADPEDRFRAHRFGWALPALARRPSAQTLSAHLALAAAWLDAHPPGEGAEGWDSYSVSERAVHWAFLLSAARGMKVAPAPRIEKSLAFHARHLLGRLELRGPATNNHLINNARALYLAGRCLGEEGLQSAGREILDFGAREMFTPSGFLREGSSHYHILVCRTFLEVLWAARTRGAAQAGGDDALWRRLRDRAAGMVRAAAFLWEGGDLPLIGDVSPDFPPEFHAGLPAAGRTILELGDSPPALRPSAGPGWRSLVSEGAEEEERPSPPPVQAYADAGYYRLARGGWRLFLYVNPLGHVPPWSHGHADLLGFVLHSGASPLFVDPGRATYLDNPLGRAGRGGRAHNGLLVDGLEACLVHGHNAYTPTLLPDYYDRPPAVSVEEGEEGPRAAVHCPGFGRIHPGLSVRRTFALADAEFRVEDEIAGAGRRLIEWHFHFHPSAEVSRAEGGRLRIAAAGGERFSLDSEGGGEASLTLQRDTGGSFPSGWFSPRYGERLRACTAVWRARPALPHARRFVLRRLG
ncbi:MAG: heparinase II/III-family protein [bacterium]